MLMSAPAGVLSGAFSLAGPPTCKEIMVYEHLKAFWKNIVRTSRILLLSYRMHSVLPQYNSLPNMTQQASAWDPKLCEALSSLTRTEKWYDYINICDLIPEDA